MDLMDFNEYIKLISSDQFKTLARKDPKAAVKYLGIDVDETQDVKIAEDRADVMHIVMPPPDTDVIEDGNIGGIAGGHACRMDTVPPIYRDLTGFTRD